MNERDATGRLLAGAVRLLPPGRRPWGTAMRGELAAIERRDERWRFVLGCVWVAATRSAPVRRGGYPLLMAGALVATLWWTGRIAYPPLHWGSVAIVVMLVTVTGLGRYLRPLGPVGKSRMARGLRAGSLLLLATWTASMLASMVDGDPAEQARNAVPIYVVMLASYLIGMLTVTADRSAATPRTLVAGLAGGVAAATSWTVTAFAVPPIPANPASAVLMIALGMVLATATAGRRDGDVRRLLAGLLAGTVAAMLILTLVVVLSSYGPSSLIPDLAAAALTPADDLAQSRIEVVDPYLWILLLGAVMATVQSATALTYRRRPATAVGSDVRVSEAAGSELAGGEQSAR